MVDEDPTLGVIAAWIAAREAGDAELAASYCHKDLQFTSPKLSLAGLQVAKKRLFGQEAPVPIEVITPLQMKGGEKSTRDRSIYYREVSFEVKDAKLSIRQEWVMTHQSGYPLIRAVSTSRVVAAAA